MEAISSLLNMIWTFINSITIPLVGITFGQLFISFVVIQVSVNILKLILGIGHGGFSHISDKEERAANKRSRRNEG